MANHKEAQSSDDRLWRLTRAAFLWTRILGTPFFCLISMLTFILYKDLHISPLQITLIVALKPMSSLLAPYWSQAIYQRPEHIKSNLVWANIFRYLPFLLIPWIQSTWYIIASFGVYMMLHRAVVPAWMEMVKRNLPESARHHMVGHGSTIDYCGNAVMMLTIGFIMDSYQQAWLWLFPFMALLGLCSTWLLLRLPALTQQTPFPLTEDSPWIKLKHQLVKPWKRSWELIRERPDFTAFQIGFMLGGGGLMIMQPALPEFFVDTLNLSYVEMGLALAVCKGIGVALTSPLWARLFRKINIFYFNSLVTFLAALFPLLLLAAPVHLVLLYVAFILYGVMQAGSEMGWHMSGIIFAHDKDSSAFSGTNVLTVGIRGCVLPALGGIILTLTNSVSVMILGGLLCLAATVYLAKRQTTITTQTTLTT